MKNLKTAFALVIVAAFLFGCGKYEEGPFFSLRTKKMRLTGEWEMNEIVIEGENRTDDFELFDQEFFEDNTFDQSIRTSILETETYEGEWEFKKNNEEIELNYDDGERIDYEITRLTNAELWVEFSGDDVEVKFRKK